jgi:hypothetical protein
MEQSIEQLQKKFEELMKNAEDKEIVDTNLLRSLYRGYPNALCGDTILLTEFNREFENFLNGKNYNLSIILDIVIKLTRRISVALDKTREEYETLCQKNKPSKELLVSNSSDYDNPQHKIFYALYRANGPDKRNFYMKARIKKLKERDKKLTSFPEEFLSELFLKYKRYAKNSSLEEFMPNFQEIHEKGKNFSVSTYGELNTLAVELHKSFGKELGIQLLAYWIFRLKEDFAGLWTCWNTAWCQNLQKLKLTKIVGLFYESLNNTDKKILNLNSAENLRTSYLRWKKENQKNALAIKQAECRNFIYWYTNILEKPYSDIFHLFMPSLRSYLKSTEIDKPGER